MKFIRDLISEKRSAKHSDVVLDPTPWEAVQPPAAALDALKLDAPLAEDLPLEPSAEDEVTAEFDDALDLADDLPEELVEDLLLDEVEAGDDEALEAIEDAEAEEAAAFEDLTEDLEDELEAAEFDDLDSYAEEVEPEPFERSKLWENLRDEASALEEEEASAQAESAEAEADSAEEFDIGALDLSAPIPAPAINPTAAPAAVATTQDDDHLDLSGLPFIHVAKADPAPQPGPLDVSQAAFGRGTGRTGRVKTRLLGFNPGGLAQANPFEKAQAEPETSFPVGWMVVVAGPGRGASFALFDGVSKIGRGEDQAIALNFGDNSISRENHAAIAYDSEQNAFYIGQSGKANLVRLNNKPLLSTEQIRSGDQVRLGETTLRFVALCGEDFSWDNNTQKDVKHAG